MTATPLHPCATVSSDGDRPLEALGDAIGELAARLHAATYELLVLLREFDERHGWNTGFLSCAHWLSWRTGIAPGAAREKVRVARALASLPRISEAMQRGELSYAKVRAITRVGTSENETRLLDVGNLRASVPPCVDPRCLTARSRRPPRATGQAWTSY